VQLDEINKMGDYKSYKGVWFFLGKFKRPSHHMTQPKNKNYKNLKSSHLEVKLMEVTRTKEDSQQTNKTNKQNK
jgi:hypothetical protein